MSGRPPASRQGMARNRWPADVAGLPVATSVPSADSRGSRRRAAGSVRVHGWWRPPGGRAGTRPVGSRRHRAASDPEASAAPGSSAGSGTGPPLVALHAKILIDVGRAIGNRSGRRAVGRWRSRADAVRIVADRAGLTQVIGAAGLTLLGVVGGHTPSRQIRFPFVARSTTRIVCGGGSTLLQYHRAWPDFAHSSKARTPGPLFWLWQLPQL